jgi:hypothetical protein
MGATNSFYRIVLDATGSSGDYPRGYQIAVSNDGSTWSSPVATGNGSSAVATINFSPQVARYIRVTQTGSTSGWWSIHEFNVFGVSGTPPAAPAQLTAAPGTNQVALNWFPTSGATGYNLKRSLTNGGAYTMLVTNLAALGYTDTGLLNNATYYYMVSAVNAAGEGGNSPQASATLLQPFPVSASAVSAGQIQLSWTTNDHGAAFKVYFTRDFTPPVVWTPTTNIPVMTGNQWTVTLSLVTNSRGFYRLQK